VTVAPIPTTIRGLSTEIAVGPANGLGDRCVVACDHVTTIRVTALGRQVGLLLDEQAANPTNAIHAAFDLD
jgi:mRNA interferase MazF